MSVWGNEWHKLSSDEKSGFCVTTSSEAVNSAPKIVENSPVNVATSAAVERQMTEQPDNDTLPQNQSSEIECDDDTCNGKKWNCYTVFIKEGLANNSVHLTKVRYDEDYLFTLRIFPDVYVIRCFSIFRFSNSEG